jgi:hypothetical protein
VRNLNDIRWAPAEGFSSLPIGDDPMTPNTFGPQLSASHGAEAHMPPGPRGVVELLRRYGRRVVVRQQRTGSLRYSVDGSREMTALAMANHYLEGAA